MKKIAVLDGHLYPEGEYAEVEQLCREKGLEFVVLDCKTPEEVVEKAADVDVALCVYVPINDAVLSKLPKLQMVVRFGIGVDNLNLPDFTKNGVYACNVPDYGVEEVAVHALALILALERKICLYNQSTHGGEWKEEIGYDMRRVSHRTVGMLGFGRTARKLAQFTNALGYKLIAYDPFLPDALFDEVQAKKVTVDELFAQSDVMVLMAPATKETIHIFNDENIAKAKDGLLVVNTGRGPLIKTESLIRGLNSGKVAAAALDVLEKEPPTGACKELLGMSNVLITPHIAYRSVESFEALKRMAGETGITYLTEGKIKNVVNTEVINNARR